MSAFRPGGADASIDFNEARYFLWSAVSCARRPFARLMCSSVSYSAASSVPPVLAEAAAEGVTPLVVLIETYPDAARAALAVAREGQTGTITGFLQTQLGARSVTPRDGEDADAILSRAEAAVGEGRLGDALTELSALPDPAKAAMADWLAAAQARATLVRLCDGIRAGREGARDPGERDRAREIQ